MKKIFTLLVFALFCTDILQAQISCPTGNNGSKVRVSNGTNNQIYLEFVDATTALNTRDGLQGGGSQIAIILDGTVAGEAININLSKSQTIIPSGNPFRIRSNVAVAAANGDFTGTVTFNPSGNGSGDYITCTYAAGILPVMYARFNAEKQAKTAVLSWTTGSEINNDYFVIEHSNDGKNYTAIGEVKGMGNSDEFVDYQFTDENPMEGMNYYRLRQIDFDGAENMSETKVVKMGNREATALTVYPSLTEGELTVDLVDYTEAKLNTQIVSGSGAVVRTFTLNGASKSIVNVTDLMSGLYFISVQSKNEVAIAKFVVK